MSFFLEDSDVEPAGLGEIELGTGPLTRGNDVGERRPVLLGQREKQISPRAHDLETRRIEVDSLAIELDFASELLDGDVSRIMELTEPVERRVDALDRLKP